jgi:hypothetical protein
MLYCAVLCGAVLYCAVLCCAVLYCDVLCCAVLCCAVLCCTVLCCAMLCCAVLCCAVLCCAVLCCTVLCCAVRCCTVLCCAVLCFTVMCCAVLCCAVLCCTVLCCAMLCCAVLCCAVGLAVGYSLLLFLPNTHFLSSDKPSFYVSVSAGYKYPRIQVIGKHVGVPGEGKMEADREGGEVKKDAQFIVNSGKSLKCSEDYVVALNVRQDSMAVQKRRKNVAFLSVEYDKSNIADSVIFEPYPGIQSFHYVEAAKALFIDQNYRAGIPKLEYGLRFYKVTGVGNGMFVPLECLRSLISPGAEQMVVDEEEETTSAGSNLNSNAQKSGPSSSNSSSSPTSSTSPHLPMPQSSLDHAMLPTAHYPSKVGKKIDEIDISGKKLTSHKVQSEVKVR